MARGSSRVTITFLRPFKADEKGAKQMKDIAGVLETLGVGKAVPRQDVVKAIEDSGKLTTRQTPDRILAYYQGQMKELGIIRIDELPPDPNAPKPEPKAKVGGKGAPAAKAPAAGGTAATSTKTPAAAPTGGPRPA